MDWLDRLARLAALDHRVAALTDAVKTLSRRVEDHEARLVRLETIIEIVQPGGAVLRLASRPATDPSQ